MSDSTPKQEVSGFDTGKEEEQLCMQKHNDDDNYNEEEDAKANGNEAEGGGLPAC